MSDAVFAAMIAAGATVFTSLVQLRTQLAKDAVARTTNIQRKIGRTRVILLGVIVVAAAVGGFAISQWFAERERAAQNELRKELQARVAELSRMTSQLQQTHAQTRSEIQSEVFQRLGAEGIVALATVGPCKPAPVQQPIITPETLPTDSPSPATQQTAAAEPACSEAEATPVSVCAAIPGMAVVSEVELFTRFADSNARWTDSRILPGQELHQARFSDQPTEWTDDDNTRHVCHTFTNWSAQHGRQARMIVRYSM
jgi:hypothetical protein